MPKDTSIHKVLVIGSGPIVIGQAAEFDYAGAQACRILREEGLDVVLVNSNPATIMTDKHLADEIYLEALNEQTVARVIEKERPDGLLAGLGGQTGLTIAMQLSKSGVLDRYGVRLLGTDVAAIEKAEDREQFRATMQAIGQPCVPSEIAETVEDAAGNVIAICSMENVDPVGVHTGDSIVVAPALTLSNKEYQMLRTAALEMISALGIVGGCNCQFALDSDSFEYAVIEVKPRVSRSSALASKATGYPIAKVTTRLALGYTLDEIKNDVTGKTCACFEPAIDYVVVKFPKWPFDKFAGSSRTLGTQMKATGEVMAIGQRFEEALMKAVRGADALPEFHYSYKLVDTCAAEFGAQTPYFYSCTDKACESRALRRSGKPVVVVLGSGPIRIGQGIEFDYSSVHCVWTLRALGYDVVIVNNNPETVSTDYDTADRLYFEPLTPEDVMGIIAVEKPIGVVVAFGGQTAIKLTKFLDEHDIPILGTSAAGIDLAEDCARFDALLESFGIRRPKGAGVNSLEEALFKGLTAAGFHVPGAREQKATGVLLSVEDNDYQEILSLAKRFYDMGLALCATSGTAAAIRSLGLTVYAVKNASESDEIVRLMDCGEIHYIVYTGAVKDATVGDYTVLHRQAMQRGVPCLTSLDTANALADIMESRFTLQNVELVDVNHMRPWRRRVHFAKMHTCGNDYIFIEDFDGRIDCPESLCVSLCAPRTGIGGNGIVLMQRSAADVKMRSFNRDGGERRIAGNNLRCVGKYLYDKGFVRGEYLSVETADGVHLVRLYLRDGKVSSAAVDMGRAAVERGYCEAGRDVTVKFSGGDLAVNCTPERVVLTGGAFTACEGEFEY